MPYIHYILMDYEMPLVDGRKLYDIIASNPKLNRARMAYLYATTTPGYIPMSSEKWIEAFIEKSISKYELKEKINEILAREYIRKSETSILILCSETGPLKEMRNTLIDKGYSVKTVRSVTDAAVCIENHSPELLIICSDIYKNNPNDIYDVLSSRLFKNNVQSVIMTEYCFATELIDKVENSLR